MSRFDPDCQMPYLQPFISYNFEPPFVEPLDIQSTNHNALMQIETQILEDDFESLGLKKDDIINLNLLRLALNKSRRLYDIEIVQKVYAQLDLKYPCKNSGKFTAGDFIRAYIKRKKELMYLMEISKRGLDAANKIIYDADLKLREYSTFKIEHDSQGVLFVQIVSVQNIRKLKEDRQYLYKVRLECHNQFSETRIVPFQCGLMYFNEVFSFDIKNCGDELKFELRQIEAETGNEVVIGDCSIMVLNLQDQRKHELRKEIWGFSGEFLFCCQWIFSKKLLYDSYIRESAHKRYEKLSEIEEYTSEFNRINKPFVVDEGVVKECSIFGLYSSFLESTSKLIDKLLLKIGLGNIRELTNPSLFINFIVICIASFYRPVFLDELAMVFAFWCNLDALSRWSVKRSYFFITIIFLSIFFDIMWINYFSSAWSLYNSEAHFDGISILLSLLIILFKIITITLYWKLGYDLKKKLEYNSCMGIFEDNSNIVDLINPFTPLGVPIINGI